MPSSPNAADLQLLSTIGLLLTIADVRPLIERATVWPSGPRTVRRNVRRRPPRRRDSRAPSAASVGPLDERRSRPPDLLLAVRQRPPTHSASRPPPAGQPQVRIELEQRHEHEPPRAAPPACGSVSRSEANSTPSEQQHVDVDHRGPCRTPPRRSADDTLDLLAGVEQLPRLQARSGIRTHAFRNSG